MKLRKEIFQFLGSLATVKWFCTTYIIAILPITIRAFLYFVVKDPVEGFQLFSTADIFLFSLIIFLSISNELKHVLKLEVEVEKKISHFCDIFIVLLAMALILAFVNDAKDIFHVKILLIVAIIMAFVSSAFGFGSLYLINRGSKGE